MSHCTVVRVSSTYLCELSVKLCSIDVVIKLYFLDVLINFNKNKNQIINTIIIIIIITIIMTIKIIKLIGVTYNKTQ